MIKMHETARHLLFNFSNNLQAHTEVHTGGHPNVHICMYSLWDCCECTCGNDVPYVTCACCVTVSVLGAWLVGSQRGGWW